MTIIEKLKELIAKDKTDYVLRELLDIGLDNDTHNTILLLSAQWNSLKKEYNMNTISNSDWSRNKSRINYSLLQIISDLSDNELIISNLQQKLDKVKEHNINMHGNQNTGVQDVSNSRIFINEQQQNSKSKLKMLIINSLPKDKQAISISEEIKIIEQALYTSIAKDKIETVVKNAVTFDEVFRIINSVRPSYIHFSLHLSKSQGLIFSDQNGNTNYVDKSTFSKIFSIVSKNNRPKLVFLNACNSFDYAYEIKEYVDFLIGMQDFIPDIAALAFTKGFYEILFDGEGIEYAFDAGKISLALNKIDFNSSVPLSEIPQLIKGLNNRL